MCTQVKLNKLVSCINYLQIGFHILDIIQLFSSQASYIKYLTFGHVKYHTERQGRLNSLKVVGAQLINKTHFYCEKLNSYEHLQTLWGQVPPVPPGSAAYAERKLWQWENLVNATYEHLW